MKNRTFIAVVIAIALAGINVPVRADGFKIEKIDVSPAIGRLIRLPNVGGLKGYGNIESALRC